MRYSLSLLVLSTSTVLTGCLSREGLAEGASEIGGSIVGGFLSGGPLGAVLGGATAVGGLIFGGRKAYIACARKKALKHVIQTLQEMIRSKEPISTDRILDLLSQHLDTIDTKIVTECRNEIEAAHGVLKD